MSPVRNVQGKHNHRRNGQGHGPEREHQIRCESRAAFSRIPVFAFEPGGAAGSLLRSDIVQVFQFEIRLALCGPASSSDPARLVLRLRAHADEVYPRDAVRPGAARIPIQPPGRRSSRMSSPTASPARSASLPGSHRGYRRRGIKVSHRHKTQIRHRYGSPHQMQSNRPEEIVPRNFFRSGDIFLEERSQVSVAHDFGGAPYALGVGKELSFLA